MNIVQKSWDSDGINRVSTLFLSKNQWKNWENAKKDEKYVEKRI